MALARDLFLLLRQSTEEFSSLCLEQVLNRCYFSRLQVLKLILLRLDAVNARRGLQLELPVEVPHLRVLTLYDGVEIGGLIRGNSAVMMTRIAYLEV